MLIASPPLCVGYALHVCRSAGSGIAARLGLGLALLEMLALFALAVFGALAG